MITEQEKEVIELSAKLWNEFLKLPEQHKDDVHDVRFHIHAIQNIILGRSAQRDAIMENFNRYLNDFTRL